MTADIHLSSRRSTPLRKIIVDAMKIFLHMPKTAGITLQRILLSVYGASQVYLNEDAYNKNIELAEAYLRLSPEEQAQIEILAGHVHFGIHSQMAVDAPYFTILREPVARVISTYHYIRRNEAHRANQTIKQSNMSLADFMRSGLFGDVDNGMVRMIAGYLPGEYLKYGECPPEYLDRAKRNIDEMFCFVGLTEDFNRSLVLMKRLFGWERIPLFASQNVNNAHDRRAEVTSGEMDLVLEHTNLDRPLYEYAKERFSNLVASQDEFFDREVEILQGDLLQYQELSHLCDRIKQMEEQSAKNMRAQIEELGINYSQAIARVGILENETTLRHFVHSHPPVARALRSVKRLAGRAPNSKTTGDATE